MSDQYDFGWTSAAKPGFTVLPQTKDTTSTSLTLTGRGSQNWGRDIKENLLWILESFASDTPPAHATTGQLWYDTAHKTLHVYDAAAAAQPGGPWVVSSGGGSAANSTTPPANPQPGSQWFNPDGLSAGNGSLSIWDGSQWIQLFPQPASSAVKVAFFTEYNAMVDTLNKIIGAPQGATLATAFGYNQTSATFAHESASTMTNAKWLAFLTSLTNICTFLGVNTSGISTNGFIYGNGNTIPVGIVTLLAEYNTTLTTLNSLTSGTVRFKPIASALESSTPAGGTAVRSTTWSGNISYEIIATFPNAAAIQSYFNAGGQVQIVSTLTNPGTNRDYDFQTFLFTIGTIKFSATGSIDTPGHSNVTGFYDLTNVYKLVFAFTAGNDTITVNAKMDSANVIHFQVIYGNPGTLYGGVGGTLTSSATFVRPSATYLGAPVISYPTVTGTPLQ
jgi:hypothetical protein